MSGTARILCVGDIVGKPGRQTLYGHLPAIQKQFNVDFTVVNVENSAAGFGITPALYHEIDSKAHIDAMTLGNHFPDKKELLPEMDKLPRLLRPVNLPPGTPGVGYRIFESSVGPIAVVNAIGRVFMGFSDCPFQWFQNHIEVLRKKAAIVLVDFHGEATSEKLAMGWYMDGKVTAVWGTHTHVQTADEQILPQGTAYITDIGMVGPKLGIIGMKRQPIIKRFFDQLPVRMEPEDKGSCVLNAIVIEADTQSGQALQIARIFETYA